MKHNVRYQFGLKETAICLSTDLIKKQNDRK